MEKAKTASCPEREIKDHTKGPYQRIIQERSNGIKCSVGEDGLTLTFVSWFSIDISDDTIAMLIRGA